MELETSLELIKTIFRYEMVWPCQNSDHQGAIGRHYSSDSHVYFRRTHTLTLGTSDVVQRCSAEREREVEVFEYVYGPPVYAVY